VTVANGETSTVVWDTNKMPACRLSFSTGAIAEPVPVKWEMDIREKTTEALSSLYILVPTAEQFCLS